MSIYVLFTSEIYSATEFKRDVKPLSVSCLNLSVYSFPKAYATRMSLGFSIISFPDNFRTLDIFSHICSMGNISSVGERSSDNVSI